MFKNGKKRMRNANKRVDTFIGKETSMSGTIEAKGIIHIEGLFEGKIYTEGEVIVGSGAKVRANVKGGSITLAGRIEGNVEAVDRLFICKSGVLLGDIDVGVLAVEDGAFFKGNCEMKEEKTQSAAEINPGEVPPAYEMLTGDRDSERVLDKESE